MRSTILGFVIVALLFPAGAGAGEPRADFTQTVRDLRQGVFLIGSPKRGGTGTAWVVSKKHRLLATNAHVADLYANARPGEFFAMMNGSRQTYLIERAWYHPGVQRYCTKDENLSIRSDDTKLGSVNPTSPDVAVLQLSADGPDLPVEFKFASPKTVFDLQGLPAAILGFPGHDTTAWPRDNSSIQATFHKGDVSRVTDFTLRGATSDAQAQMVQYTMQTWGGYSGSPIFLANGDVVALHNMGRTVEGERISREIAHGVRVDVLWELLVHHKLDDKIPVPLAKDKLLLQRWFEIDPNVELSERLAKLVEEANILTAFKQDFSGAVAKCNEAIKIYPRYAPAYRSRFRAYNDWYVASGRQWSAKNRLLWLEKALNDIETNIRLHHHAPVESFLSKVAVLNNIGVETGDRKYHRQALGAAEEALSLKGISDVNRAAAMSYKGAALAELGQTQDASLAHQTALQFNPNDPVLWDNRAIFNETHGNKNTGRYDRKMAAALRKKFLLLDKTSERDFKEISRVNETLTQKDARDARGNLQQSWSVDMQAGYYYQIDLKSTKFRTNKDYDPILRIHDDKNRFLAEDDDGGGYPNARIFITAPGTGTYNLTVTSYLPGQTGPFTLIVTRIARDE